MSRRDRGVAEHYVARFAGPGPRDRCAIPGCSGDLMGAAKPFCSGHWLRVPDDLVERLRYAYHDSDDPAEMYAAVQAIIAELS